MALYAFDGTGNEDEEVDTNALEFFRAFQDPRKNDDPAKPLGSLYLKGIGTRAHTRTGDLLAEKWGLGGHRRVREALDRLENNQAAGDTEIHVIGFSRGAALALSFANEIAHKYAALRVGFVGLFDVVGQFGLPGRDINAGHDLRRPPTASRICHAMALDETRLFFPLTRVSPDGMADPQVLEVWFRGVHSDVGGGNNNRTLNWVALHWMFQEAIRFGLPIDPAAVAANLATRVDPMQISDHRLDLEVRRAIRGTDLLHATVKLGAGIPGRPHNDPAVALRRIDDAGVIS
ncbi:MAG TPA: DUF2235 domain-containing protein [Vicinamibacterales bacterium]